MNNQTTTSVRKIISTPMTVTPVPVDEPTTDWLKTQAGETTWQLLAFADDGLIWGQIEAGNLSLSSDTFPNISAAWRAQTLQEARLFNSSEQIHLWSSDDGWQARRISDGVGDHTDYYDEPQILWGDTFQEEKAGFTRVSDGSLGFQHAVPLAVDKAKFDNKRRPLRLIVRHYLSADDETGAVAVTLSRLIKVEVK
jgi:CRISPR-associated protein (TIGR03984 family)